MGEQKEFCTCTEDWSGPGKPVTFSYIKGGIFWCPYCDAPIEGKDGKPRRFSDLKPMTTEAIERIL